MLKMWFFNNFLALLISVWFQSLTISATKNKVVQPWNVASQFISKKHGVAIKTANTNFRIILKLSFCQSCETTLRKLHITRFLNQKVVLTFRDWLCLWIRPYSNLDFIIFLLNQKISIDNYNEIDKNVSSLLFIFFIKIWNNFDWFLSILYKLAKSNLKSKVKQKS